MSLRKIADQAGVSISTVSRVVNNKHHGKISEETRRRVLDIARHLQYQPNQQAVALATGRPPNTLGLLLPYHSHTFRSFYFAEVSCGALDTANAQGMDVTLLVYHDNRKESLCRLITGHRVAGILLLGTEVGDEVVSICQDAGLPCVAVNQAAGLPGVVTVRCDNEGGMYAATRHLLRLGHTRIAFISGPEGLADAQEREAGYRRALDEAGIPFDERLVACGLFSEKGGRQAMRLLLERSPHPTAVIGANDQSAIAAMAVIKRAGLNIPNDIAVVGFDDIPLAQHVEPALTTIHQPIYRLGQRAARVLMERVSAPEEGEPRASACEELSTRLVIRESCGARWVHSRNGTDAELG